MECTIHDVDNQLQITLSGRFTFADSEAFRSAMSTLSSKKIQSIIVEISRLEFIDSAALGMLLLLKDEAQKNSADLILQSPTGQVKKMFELSRFDTIFSIRHL